MPIAHSICLLHQASVSDLISGKVDRSLGHVVITMRRYPRFVHRELRDEYLSEMSPDRKLFEDWLTIKRRTGSHEAAFAKSRYESRFSLSEDGLRQLARLSRLSKRKQVFLVCQCRVGQRCHREMLLIIAKKFFGAKIEGPYNEYRQFERRLEPLASAIGRPEVSLIPRLSVSSRTRSARQAPRSARAAPGAALPARSRAGRGPPRSEASRSPASRTRGA
jgi:uncharacterized protein YeaO (DUF488 family)